MSNGIYDLSRSSKKVGTFRKTSADTLCWESYTRCFKTWVYVVDSEECRKAERQAQKSRLLSMIAYLQLKVDKVHTAEYRKRQYVLIELRHQITGGFQNEFR